MRSAVNRIIACLGLSASMASAQYIDAVRYRAVDNMEDDLMLSEKFEMAEHGNFDHPALQAGQYADVRMAVLKDFNHVIDFKFGHKIDKFRLIPDTGLNEVAVQTNTCKGCTGPAGDKKYQPTNAPLHARRRT